jgi:hypothetical protein
MKRAARRRLHRLLYSLPIWLAISPAALAQQSGGQQELGIRLFNQSCRVCHTLLPWSSYRPTRAAFDIGTGGGCTG